MNKALEILCDAITQLLSSYSSVANVSFILVIGKNFQGKTCLLRQSSLVYYPHEFAHGATLFHNHEGIVVELGEKWLHLSETLLTDTLKAFNRCHRRIRITGMMFCVESIELIDANATELLVLCQAQAQFFKRFIEALPYQVETALVLTKLDTIAGFCEFFHAEHEQDLQQPLGFSLETQLQQKKLVNNYKWQFDLFIETLSQKTIAKLHPVRSSTKRTLIREFPLQLASLRLPIHTLLQQLSTTALSLRSIYFTSSEQGGLIIDKLNQKIAHEYALTVRTPYPHSKNYRAYFIKGALDAFQTKTCHLVQRPLKPSHLLLAGLLGTLTLITCIGFHYLHYAHLLQDTQEELLAFKENAKPYHQAQSLHHLSKANHVLTKATAGIFPYKAIHQLEQHVAQKTQTTIQATLRPKLIKQLEAVLHDATLSPISHYEALKVYLMLHDPKHFKQPVVEQWFIHFWQKIYPNAPQTDMQTLLKQALNVPFKASTPSRTLVLATRNYLNALPLAYLYYGLAKKYLPKHQESLNFAEFHLASQNLPKIFLRQNFTPTLQSLQQIAHIFQQENWVLARQDLNDLPKTLQQAYCQDFVTWWQQFIHKSHLKHHEHYSQTLQYAQQLHQTQALARFFEFIQTTLKPGEVSNEAIFNQKIAAKFTDVTLISPMIVRELNEKIDELYTFLTTLSLVNDQGQSMFKITKARFAPKTHLDPLSRLYRQAKLLPAPLSIWTTELADEVWFHFVAQAKIFINQKWQETILPFYQQSIAHRSPFAHHPTEVSLAHFDYFFAPHGLLNQFVDDYLKPFLDTSQPQWQPRAQNGYLIPISDNLINELIRANVISNMFFAKNATKSRIDFSLQKINLDPMIANLQLAFGTHTLTDNQESHAYTQFTWPQSDVTLSINSLEGQHLERTENGPWALFKLLEKLNVMTDDQDSASLQILFDVQGKTGRYLLKTQNQINPFSPGILSGFQLTPNIG